jgi:hypothetical protein
METKRMGVSRKPYGYELILDQHRCDTSKFNRESLQDFFVQHCRVIEMEACELHFWDDVGVPDQEKQTSPHKKGTSAVQFILKCGRSKVGTCLVRAVG